MNGLEFLEFLLELNVVDDTQPVLVHCQHI